MEMVVERRERGVDRAPLEVVERKGLGHPDRICDAVAEEASLALSRLYVERFGRVLHHNVDKILLAAGAARPAFGGGEVTEPIRLLPAGRATMAHGGERLPVDELVVETARGWLAANLRALDPTRHVRIEPLIRPGSGDLTDLFARGPDAGWPANDTSVGVGHAPFSRLERLVDAVERRIHDPARRPAHPALGEDVKVMGARSDDRFRLTVACAMVGPALADADAYEAARRHVADLAGAVAAEQDLEAEVEVNGADDPARGSYYLTVTGTSAESGDDGEAGRGNRANGLITPCRPMSLECVAGKNPITHVGKLYNVLASEIAAEIVARLDEVEEAECVLLSRIGRPVSDPPVARLAVACPGARPPAGLEGEVEAVAHRHLERAGSLWRDLLSGELALDRWPLRSPTAEPPGGL